MDKKKIVLDFIKSQHLAVVSTVNTGNKPESALVGVGETDNLELIIGTPNSTRKYKNLLSNKNVAVVIGGKEHITVQYEGVAEELEGEEYNKLTEIFYAKNPTARRFEEDPNERFFKITPSWIRYTNYENNPSEIFEITF